MRPDSTPADTASAPLRHTRRAAALHARVDAAVEELRKLRNTLHAIATHAGGFEEAGDNHDPEDLYGAWSGLDAAAAGLESVVSRMGEQGARLAGLLPDLPQRLESGEPGGAGQESSDLEELIRAQRAALVALTEQIASAETTLNRPGMKEAQRPPRYGAVEIQDVAEFLKESPIASIPVNASYYQRILEAARAPEGHKRPMGAILMEAGLITARQVENALRHQREGRKRPLGALLVDLGYTTDVAIAQTLAAQLALPFVSLAAEVIHPEAIEALPIHLARRHVCFPLNTNDGALYVAMANPLDLIALEDLRLASGRHVRPCVASREEINGHIDRHYAGSVF